MKWGVSVPGFSRRTLRLGRVTGLSWTRRVYLQSPLGWDSPCRPFQQVSPAALGTLEWLQPSLGAPASTLCPLALAASSGSCGGVVQETRCGWQDGANVGGWQGAWVPPPARSAAGAPAAMRYPPRECGPAAPPSEAGGGAPRSIQQTGCSAPGWPPTLPPLKGWHLGARQPAVATPCPAWEAQDVGDLKAVLILNN